MADQTTTFCRGVRHRQKPDPTLLSWNSTVS